jgi:hypothetical protein
MKFWRKGIDAKVDRANELISQLEAEIRDFIDSTSYETAFVRHDSERQVAVTVKGPAPPLRFSVIAGEVVHHLRASLDYLVWQLVIENGKKPGTEHQFPICPAPNDFERSCKKGRLRGVAEPARRLIEDRQPYNNTDRDYRKGTLWVLAQLDNTDKHRLLNVLIAGAVAKEIGIGSQMGDLEITGISPPKGLMEATEDGSEVVRIDFGKYQPDVTVNATVHIDVAFEEFGPIPRQPVVPGLRELSDKVSRVIDLFEPHFS